MQLNIVVNNDTPRVRAETAVQGYLARQESKSLLRFITCGSVDDGKSTLLGRLLYDARLLFDDQLAALEGDSRRHGTQGDALDFALLVDGLSAEREQGITIDVAYRFFSTERRKFIVADCPGHEQYTRNMATGASTADLAVVLVDARKGLLTQTRRHSWICRLLGIRHVVLAVNKMDLVDFDEAVLRTIEADYRALAAQLGIAEVTVIPLSALNGDNVGAPSAQMPWYRGPTLLAHLESVPLERPADRLAFRMPVQWVCRPDSGFRGFTGQIAAGGVRQGDEVVVLPSGERTRVARIVSADGELHSAVAGQPVNLVMADEVDISRGDVIAAAAAPAPIADGLAAHLLWLDEQALRPGHPYWLKLGTRTVNARITRLRHRIDVNTQAQLPAARLAQNEVGYCEIRLDQELAFEPYASSQRLGAFILIDRQSHATVAAGTVDSALAGQHVRWQDTTVDAAARARIKGQQPACLWFTGLSGAGKSTLANRVESLLHSLGHHTCLLDGDNLRHGLNSDLGFSAADRDENIRRVAHAARLMTDAGLIVLVSFISPLAAQRARARALFAPGEFIEVFVDTPLALCEQRDVKGLYARARAGQIADFTGIDAPYEAPEAPELHLHAAAADVDQLARRVVEHLLGEA